MTSLDGGRSSRVRAASIIGAPPVLICITSLRDAAVLRSAIARRPCRVVDLASTVCSELGSIPAFATVIIEPLDSSGRSTDALVIHIRTHRSDIAVVGLIAAREPYGRERFWGAHLDSLLITSVAEGRSVVQASIERGERRALERVVLSRLVGKLPGRLEQLAKCCIATSSSALPVAKLAALLGVTRRTLVNHCAGEHFPRPAEFATWMRLLVASCMLERPDRTIASVALALEFSTDTSLRRAFKTYSGCCGSDLRQYGAFQRVLAAFDERVATLQYIAHSS